MKSTLFIVLGSLILCPSAAGAAPIYFSTASANATVFQGPGPLDSSDELLQIIGTDTLGPISASASALGNSASSWASVTDGSLHAFATATDSFFDGTSAQAGAGASFNDTLLIQSNTLTFGTPVQLRFEAALSASITPCPNGSNAGAYAFGQLSSGSFIQDHCVAANDVHQPISFVSTTVGAELQIFATLNVFAGAGGAGGTATADAANTLRFFVTPLGDFSFTSASGNTYQRISSAPEPASLLLLGTALVGAGVRRWGQKRR